MINKELLLDKLNTYPDFCAKQMIDFIICNKFIKITYRKKIIYINDKNIDDYNTDYINNIINRIDYTDFVSKTKKTLINNIKELYFKKEKKYFYIDTIFDYDTYTNEYHYAKLLDVYAKHNKVYIKIQNFIFRGNDYAQIKYEDLDIEECLIDSGWITTMDKQLVTAEELRQKLIIKIKDALFKYTKCAIESEQIINQIII